LAALVSSIASLDGCARPRPGPGDQRAIGGGAGRQRQSLAGAAGAAFL